MKKISYIAVLFVVSVLAVTGCRSGMVLNIKDASFTTASKQSDANIKKAIIKAGGMLGWQMKAVAPGHLTATLVLRKHVAVVDITYTKSTYSIKYKDSTNLNYDGETIHSNYNSWITNLDRRIKVELVNM